MCPSQRDSRSATSTTRTSTVASKWAKVNRNYKLLAEVGVRPRTSFLARIRNPNPKLKGNG